MWLIYCEPFAKQLSNLSDLDTYQVLDSKL